jgi:lipopolysaccharide/colanic/teichoic acid biosynthesis glycosyltransferase
MSAFVDREYRSLLDRYVSRPQTTFYQRRGKRLLDLALTIPALILLAPLLLLVAGLVRMRLGSPVLFRQRRAGRYGHPFTILKFRTMTEERDATGRRLPDSQRLTRLGRLLRATSIDELPELFNVSISRFCLSPFGKCCAAPMSTSIPRRCFAV